MASGGLILFGLLLVLKAAQVAPALRGFIPSPGIAMGLPRFVWNPFRPCTFEVSVHGFVIDAVQS
ncbi:hypothetical protein MITS9509_01215 [Synechococcus sp. MIT S9509]|nr:hypothetical protein MITS9504_00780 [Synechococcus sp. MIT S9504]KZR92766.1 hypothetical protein MITS9509_01215 [Synechococcus sp. MIT S9509]